MNSASTRAPRLLALAALACLAGGALAQQQGGYPTKPIQLIAQQPPGSGSDAMTRAWADCAARELGQAVVVQNKPGANGILGINFGSPGKGSPAHLLTSALVDKLGVPGTHVPFVGEGAGLTALMGQQIHAMTLVIGTAAAQVKAGKLVPLALFGAQRSALLPDVPTIAEALPAASDLARPAWIAVVAKAGTPPELLNRLNAVTEKCRGGDA